LNERFRPEIPKTPEPTRELLCTADCNHLDIVALWLRGGKCSAPQPQSEDAILRTLRIRRGRGSGHRHRHLPGTHPRLRKGSPGPPKTLEPIHSLLAPTSSGVDQQATRRPGIRSGATICPNCLKGSQGVTPFLKVTEHRSQPLLPSSVS
jgi:hypothetical protein